MQRRKYGGFASLFSTSDTFSPQPARTQALLEILDGNRDARIIRSFKNARAQGKTQREKECGASYFEILTMTRCAATTAENPKKRLGARQLPSCTELTFNAIFKCTTYCWKSCKVDNLEQMTKTDNFGTTWVENVNRVNLCISATLRQMSASKFVNDFFTETV